MNISKERYEASMILHAVGDSIGYKNNEWESNQSTYDIHKCFNELGGIESIKCDSSNWPVSDDTVLNLANAECLVDFHNYDLNSFCLKLVDYYKKALENEDHQKRSFGYTTVQSITKHLTSDSYEIPFNIKYVYDMRNNLVSLECHLCSYIRGYGCGASMRSNVFGLRFPRADQFENLVEFSIQTSKMTHHHPLGYLGGYVAALFTTYALQDKPIYTWGAHMLQTLPLVRKFVEKNSQFLNENLSNWSKFEDSWIDYLKLRQIETGQNDAIFPEIYGINERDAFYKKYALNSRYGSAGHDSVIIAYDALLGSKNNWNELCLRAILHGGDNDSTGCIASSWYGALYGFENVSKCNYENVEYKERLLKCANILYEINFSK